MNEHEILKRIIPYVPPYWVRQAFADPEHTLVGREERIYAAVLFVDISGFTTIAEALSRRGREGVEELSALLDRYFDAMSKPVFALGGEVVKFAGDALIVTFPAQPDGDDAHLGAALHCALRMQSAMAEFEQLHTSAGIFPLRMKIGIGEGAIYNTTVGDESKEMQTVFAGRPLARCQQAEKQADPGEIVADAALINRMPGHLDIGEARDTFRPIYGATNVPTLPPIQQPDVDALQPEQAEMLIQRLSPYLPRQLVERIHQGQRGVYGEHRWVTVMFVKFGGLNYDWEPQVGEALQIYYTTMRDCILRYGGRLNEVDIGASGGILVVFFGAPTSYEDGELRAVSCAWEMQQAVDDVRMRAGTAAERLQQCIGVSSNAFFVGDVGTPMRRTYAAVGDEVNLASRLMHLAEWGQVIVTSWVQKRVVGPFDFEAMGQVQVKGKVESAPIYALLAPSVGISTTTANSPAITNRLPLIGRDAELVALKAAQKRAWHGEPQLVSICGQAGVGKSRLVNEFMCLWIKDGGVAFIGECHRRGDRKAYGPWARILHGVFGLQEDTLERQREKIQTQLALLSPKLPSQVETFMEWMGLTTEPDRQQRSKSAHEHRAQCHQQLTDFFITLSKRQPLLLILDNAHDIDNDSLVLLGDLVKGVENAPFSICVLYRPTASLSLENEISTSIIHTLHLELDELGEENSLTLARRLLVDAGLSIDLAPLVVDQAQGNPFYLHEMVRTTLASSSDQDILSGDGVTVGSTAVSEGIVALVQSQIDHLDEDTKLTLRLAAVIGRRFVSDALRAAHPMPISPSDLQARLDTLEHLHIVRRDQANGRKGYLFEQEMTRKVIYARLLSLDRERFHHQVAQAIETVYANNLIEWSEPLADHFRRSNEWDKAASYLIQAGQHAIDLQDYQRAEPLYDLAAEMLRWCERDPDQHQFVHRTWLELLLRRGGVHWQLLHMSAALRDYERAAQLAGALADLGAQGNALLRAAEIQFRQARYPDAQFSAHQAMQRFSALDAHISIARVLHLLARLSVVQGAFERAKELFKQALKLAEKTDNSLGLVHCQIGLGHTQYITGHLDSAVDILQRALNAKETTDNHARGEGLESLVQVLVYRGRWGQAMQLARQQKDAVTSSPPLDAAYAYRTLGLVLTRIGAYQEACTYLTQAIETFREAEWVEALLPCFWMYGEALLGLERHTDADHYFHQALNMGQKSNTVQIIIQAKLGLSKLAAIDRNWIEEQRLCTEARAIARKANYDILTVAARIGLARAYLGRREWRAAQRTALLARTSSRSRCPYNTFRSEAMLGEAMLGLSHRERALEHFRKAGAMIDLLAGSLSDPYHRMFLDRPYIKKVRAYARSGELG